ncbi:MAG: FeoB-associated Cys-rich membrane protein [Pirellulales bacterium]|nr:FeoB-associated Cys-rich membrane protein [Pirellulales bacterium]
MILDWQNAVALSLVAAALFYVLRRLRRTTAGGRDAGCGTCSRCGAPSVDKPLVSIDPPSDSSSPG